MELLIAVVSVVIILLIYWIVTDEQKDAKLEADLAAVRAELSTQKTAAADAVATANANATIARANALSAELDARNAAYGGYSPIWTVPYRSYSIYTPWVPTLGRAYDIGWMGRRYGRGFGGGYGRGFGRHHRW